MNRLRATRLAGRGPERDNAFNRRFPHGSLRRLLVFYAFIPIFAVMVLGLITDRIIMPAVTRQGSAFPLPDFTNQKIDEARVSLGDLSLSYEVASQEYSPGKPTGVILQQYPKAGTKVKPGRSIKFVTSLGQKMVAIPDVSGKSVRQAMLDLETAGLSLGEIAWAFADTIPERVVVFSYPEAGREIPLGSPVNLMVNRGRASNFTFMPKVAGLTLTDARKRLEEKSLKIGIITYRTDENFLPETVLEQSEAEGTELDVGTEIDLVVSTIE